MCAPSVLPSERQSGLPLVSSGQEQGDKATVVKHVERGQTRQAPTSAIELQPVRSTAVVRALIVPGREGSTDCAVWGLRSGLPSGLRSGLTSGVVCRRRPCCFHSRRFCYRSSKTPAATSHQTGVNIMFGTCLGTCLSPHALENVTTSGSAVAECAASPNATVAVVGVRRD